MKKLVDASARCLQALGITLQVLAGAIAILASQREVAHRILRMERLRLFSSGQGRHTMDRIPMDTARWDGPPSRKADSTSWVQRLASIWCPFEPISRTQVKLAQVMVQKLILTPIWSNCLQYPLSLMLTSYEPTVS